ncbi:MAG: hypothetical protein PVJ27_01105 [Candidatus Brocadiaceae bacterium]|jgi:hypothetical protein
MSRARERFVAFGLLLVVLLSGGCATYWADRGNDALDILDAGVTVSAEPGFSLYGGFLNVFSLGYSHVDGTLLGTGGREVGGMEMRHNAGGLALWGYEQFGYRDFDATDPASPDPWRVGVIGLSQGPGPTDGQLVNCPKLLHLGWVGLMLNCKFGELADFLLGWATCDIMSDDAAG